MVKGKPLGPRWRWTQLLISGLLVGCVAGSEGPQGPLSPSDPEPGLKADLTAGPIGVPDHIRVDSVLEMEIGVRNGGTRSVGPGWVIQVLLSTDPIIDSTDVPIDHFTATRELAPGAEDQYLRHKKLPGRMPTGPYFIGSILDITQVVPEVSEGNNTLRFPATILLTPKVSTPPIDNYHGAR